VEAANTLVTGQTKAGAFPIYTQFEYPEIGDPETSTQQSITKSMNGHSHYNKSQRMKKLRCWYWRPVSNLGSGEVTRRRYARRQLFST